MKKLGSFIKNNVIGFILGAIIFGGSALVVAGTVASSDITYTNNNQSNVQGALNDLYSKTNNLPYRFWTDNFSDVSYSEGSVPSTVYTNYNSIRGEYTSQAFIRTSYVNGIPDKHSACLYLGSTNKVFCLDNGFWEVILGSTTQSYENVTAVNSALKIAMEKALGTSSSRTFYYNGSIVLTQFKVNDSNYGQCLVVNDGTVSCTNNFCGYSGNDCELVCTVYPNGEANCKRS